uniref:stage II sporulation protein M n=1 Tax=Allorhizocola rhizosphaerae TaxID=1872709 RepID=UPI001FED0B0A
PLPRVAPGEPTARVALGEPPAGVALGEPPAGVAPDEPTAPVAPGEPLTRVTGDEPSARVTSDERTAITVAGVDLDAYVAEHRGEWRRLGQLSRKYKLSALEADELVLLYQRVATHLSVVRSRTPDPALVAELSRLVLSARAALTGPTRFSWRRVPRFFAHDMPLAFYVARWWWIVCGLSFVAVAGVVIWWVSNDLQVARDFGISDAAIQDIVGGGFEGYYSEYFPQNFGALVWVNNSFIAAICLASGVLVLPPLLVLWQNAVSVGMVGGIMVAHGEADTFFGLIAPHGMLELTAIFVSAGIGMRMGWAWVDPGPILTRAQSLAAAARQAIMGAMGLVVVLAVSAVIEAFVTPAPFPILVRDFIGFVIWAAFIAYVWILGSQAARRLEREVGVGDLAGEDVGGAVEHVHAAAGQR